MWLLCALMVLGLSLTSACSGGMGKTYPPYRYRLTVEVETPQGLRSGSSVIEVETIKGGAYALSGGGGGDLINRVKGQGAAVDLPNGRMLFALLEADWGWNWPENLYALQVPRPTQQEVASRSPDGKWNPNLSLDMWMERVAAARGQFVVPRWREGLPQKLSGWPMFVRFRDLRDSASVEEVKPEELKAAFGEGYALRRVTVERTDDPVSYDISKHLPWLVRPDCILAPHPRDRDGALVPMKDVSLAVRLTCQDFRTGTDGQ